MKALDHGRSLYSVPTLTTSFASFPKPVHNKLYYMNKKLLSLSTDNCLKNRKVHLVLCIFLFAVCGEASTQPIMLSQIPNTSKNFVSVNGNLFYSVAGSLYKG